MWGEHSRLFGRETISSGYKVLSLLMCLVLAVGLCPGLSYADDTPADSTDVPDASVDPTDVPASDGGSNGWDGFYDDPSIVCDGDFAFRLLDEATNTYSVIAYKGADSQIVVPFMVGDGVGIVTRIGDSVFADRTFITSVSIPDTVTDIGFHTFRNCENLESVKLPSSLSSLGGGAFANDVKLGSISIPATLNSCGGSYETLIDASGQEHPDVWCGPFANCSGLTSVAFPVGKNVVPSRLMSGCTGLQSVTLPDSIAYIEDNAFAYCYSLSSVSMPSQLDSLGGEAFRECTSLITVDFNEGLSWIADSAFAGCTALERVTITDRAEYTSNLSIGNSAFAGCTALECIVLPEGTARIGSSAFSGCTSLVSAVLPGSLEQVGALTFRGCSSLESVTFASAQSKLAEIPTAMFYQCEVLDNVVLPSHVAAISSYAFASCSSLKTITIPRATTSINSSAFESTGGLTIHGTPESAAQAFASEHGFAFVARDDAVTGVSISPASVWLAEDDGSTQLTAIVEPANAFDDSVTWSSSNEWVVRVDQYGYVWAVNSGTAEICATANDGSGCYGTCAVTVENSESPAVEVHVVNSVDEFESPHEYVSDVDQEWVYTVPGAQSLNVRFDERTDMGEGYITVYRVFESDGVFPEVGFHSPAGQLVHVDGNTVRIRLHKDAPDSVWGFKVASVVKDPIAVEQPIANTDLVYTGEVQYVAPESDAYTLCGTYSATNANWGDSYPAYALLNDGYVWENGSTWDVYFEWNIDPAQIDMSNFKLEDATFTYDGQPHSIRATGLSDSIGVWYDRNEVTDVGVYQVYMGLDSETERNYTGLYFTDDEGNQTLPHATLTILPAESSISLESSSVSLAPDGAIELPVMAVGDGTVYVSSSNGAKAWASYDAHRQCVLVHGVAAGSATIEIGMENTHNYTIPEPFKLEVSIENAGGEEGSQADGKKSLAGAIMTGLPLSMTYTGSNVAPEFTLTYGGEELVAGRDYFPLYSNNVSVGTVHVAAFGVGDYSGWVHGTFAITAANINKASVQMASKATYTGSAVKPAAVLTFNDAELAEGTDYDVTYSNNVNAGTAQVTFEGKGNFLGTMSVPFEIEGHATSGSSGGAGGASGTSGGSTGGGAGGSTGGAGGAGGSSGGAAGGGNSGGSAIAKGKTSIDKAEIRLSSTALVYNGKAQQPTVQDVVLNGVSIMKDCDVAFSPADSVSAGTYRVTATAHEKSNTYTSSATATYTITPANLGKANVVLSSAAFTANGQVQVPAVSKVEIAGVEIPPADYVVAYETADSSAVGEYRVSVKPSETGNLEGVVYASYSIVQAADSGGGAGESGALPTVSGESTTDSRIESTTGPISNVANVVLSSGALVSIRVLTADTAAITHSDVPGGAAVSINSVAGGSSSYKVTEIAGKSFKGTGAKSVIIGNNVRTIGASAFSGATQLVKATVGANVTTIGAKAFSGNVKLSTLIIGKSVKTIEKNAFKGCKALKKVIVKSGSLTKASCRNLVKGTSVKTVKLSGKAAKAMASMYKKWFPKGITVKR